MKYSYLLAAALPLLGACSYKPPADSQALPGGVDFVVLGSTYSVLPLKLKDGTYCVVSLRHGSAAMAMSCDFTCRTSTGQGEVCP